MIRKPISKRTRFEVFKRDSFTCQYCAAKPPLVPLEVDHIIPVSKGGLNQIDNLITACFDCNRGKSDKELTSIPESLIDKNERMKLARAQYLSYSKLLKKQRELIEKDIDIVEDVFIRYNEHHSFNDRFRISVKQFIEKLGVDRTIVAMEKACQKVYKPEGALNYFCGICWNTIKGT